MLNTLKVGLQNVLVMILHRKQCRFLVVTNGQMFTTIWINKKSLLLEPILQPWERLVDPYKVVA